MYSIVQTLTYLASTTKGAWLVFLSLTPYNMGVYGLHWTQLGHQYRYCDKFTVLFSTFLVLKSYFKRGKGTLGAGARREGARSAP